jgi:hypothetical protein
MAAKQRAKTAKPLCFCGAPATRWTKATGHVCRPHLLAYEAKHGRAVSEARLRSVGQTDERPAVRRLTP